MTPTLLWLLIGALYTLLLFALWPSKTRHGIGDAQSIWYSAFGRRPSPTAALLILFSIGVALWPVCVALSVIKLVRRG